MYGHNWEFCLFLQRRLYRWPDERMSRYLFLLITLFLLILLLPNWLCLDINECEILSKPCGPNAVCENTSPGFNCLCPQGYSGKPDPKVACEQVNNHFPTSFLIYIIYSFVCFINRRLTWRYYVNPTLIVPLMLSALKVNVFVRTGLTPKDQYVWTLMSVSLNHVDHIQCVQTPPEDFIVNVKRDT